MCAFGGFLGYGVLRAIYHGNDQYYLLAELYHWFVELTLVAIVTRLALTGTPADSAKVMIIACFLVGSFTAMLVAGCYAGIVPGGGYFQAGSLFWHLKAGVNFPQVPLMLALLALFRCSSIGNSYRAMGWIGVVSCGVLLVLTLKRTMWLSTIGCIACAMLPKGQIRQAATWISLLGIIVIAGVIARGSEVFGLLDFMTYNDAYSVSDTMEDRTNQLSDAVRLFSTAGEGLGAEVDIYKVNINKVDRVHYIHSLYVYQIVQFGIPIGVAALLLLFWMTLNVLSQSNRPAVNDWRADAGLACLLAVAINGVTLVSLHSAFAGVAFGVAFAALNERSLYTNLLFHSTFPEIRHNDSKLASRN